MTNTASLLQTPDCPDLDALCDAAWRRVRGDLDFDTTAEATAFEAKFRDDYAAGFHEGFREASERGTARCHDIICHPEAKGRDALARHIALHTNMTVPEAVAMLKASPKEAAADPASRYGLRTKDSPCGLITFDHGLNQQEPVKKVDYRSLYAKFSGVPDPAGEAD